MAKHAMELAAMAPAIRALNDCDNHFLQAAYARVLRLILQLQGLQELSEAEQQQAQRRLQEAQLTLREAQLAQQEAHDRAAGLAADMAQLQVGSGLLGPNMQR